MKGALKRENTWYKFTCIAIIREKTDSIAEAILFITLGKIKQNAQTARHLIKKVHTTHLTSNIKNH